MTRTPARGWHRLRRGLAIASLGASMVSAGTSHGTAAAGPASQWYATDLHVHSTVSADARPDLGILTKNARAAGMNAIFLTDHNQASDFLISTRSANNAFFDAPTHDDLNRWTAVGSGVRQVGSPVHSGTASTHLTSSGSGEQFLWSVRGPNFRAGSGAVTTTFSVYPTSLGAGSSLYVSASFGGDVTIQKAPPGPEGYTPSQTGVPASCKSVVFVWYFGAAPDPARYQPTATSCNKISPIPQATVKEFPITAALCDKPLTLNTWNTCTLDVDAAVATLAAADMPYDYLGLSELKVAALGTVDAYVDDYATKKALPAGSTVDSRAGDEFAARNALIPLYDDPAGNFRLFPSLEEGTTDHAQRFNFGITSAGQFTTFCNGSCNYSSGVSGIGPTEASGYPGQLNHPGVSGGVSDAAAVGACSNGLTPACGGDTMEVRLRNMSNDWDTILKTGTPLVGDYGSDNHLGSWSGSSLATFLYAPSNGFDVLMQALFEGRAYDAKLGTSSGHVSLLLNVGTSATEPYPARYPLYVPSGQAVGLHVTLANIASGSFVRWVQNGVIGPNEMPNNGTSYDATRSLALSGSSAYARVEVGTSATANADGTTQAIILKPAASGLPSGMNYHVERVTPASGQHTFTKGVTKGITASSWSANTQSLTLTLTDQVGSLAEVRVASVIAPQSVIEDGSSVPAAGSLAAFQDASGASWFHDGATVYVKALAATGTDSIVLSFGTAGATVPDAPSNVSASAGDSQATVSWTAPAANGSPISGYTISGTPTGSGSAPSGATSATVSGLTNGTSYTFTVTATNGVGPGPPSAASNAVTPTAGGGGATLTLVPIADAKVDASAPTTNYGGVALRVDGSPVVRSYLKFNASALSGPVQTATLRIWATSAQSTGFDVYAVTDSTWTETGLTAANQPSGSISPTKLGSSGAVSAGSWTTVDVTALLGGPGIYSVMLQTTSSTALALASREDAAHAPQLVVTTSGSATVPDAPSNVSASAGDSQATVSWTAPAANGSPISGYAITGTPTGSASAPSGATSATVTGLTNGTRYTFVVTATNGVGPGPPSAASNAVTPTGGAGGATVTLVPIADAKVDASTPTTNYASAALRVDGSPVVRSYLKFNASALSGPVQTATLRIWATSAQSVGFDVYAVADTSWTETGLTAATQPSGSISATKLGSSGPVSAGTWKTIDVTALLTAPGVYSIVLQTTSSTALALASREDVAHAPQLVVTTSAGGLGAASSGRTATADVGTNRGFPREPPGG